MTASVARAVVCAVACTVGMLVSSVARADIYTWVDAAGSLNVSNLPPPDGVQVQKVVRDSPPRPSPPPNAQVDANRQAEVQMLAERVQQLERQVTIAQSQPPPVITYAPPPVNMQPQVQYTSSDSLPPSYAQNASCDPSWTDCGTWSTGIGYAAPYNYYPYLYPANVIVVRSAPFRRYDPPGRHYPPGYGSPGNHRSPMPVPTPRPSPNVIGMRTR